MNMGWMDGRTDGRTDGRMDGWMCGVVSGTRNERKGRGGGRTAVRAGAAASRGCTSRPLPSPSPLRPASCSLTFDRHPFSPVQPLLNPLLSGRAA
eukprot:304704-Chlamydomonas_euryale.AAC.2